MTAADSQTSSLANRLRERIKRDGLINFHDWMNAALYDEADGYYCRKDWIRQGRAGDYRTAPETSPLFGATFASYFARCHQELGAADGLTIVEVGAGHGDFAGAALTALQSSFPAVFDRTRYLIDEVNEHEVSVIQNNLVTFQEQVSFGRLAEIEPIDFAIVFSNELLDAFPVHRLIGRAGELRELYVALDDNGEFVWSEGEVTARVADYARRIDLRLDEGQIYEVNLAAEDFLARAASKITSGFVISVDYGSERNELLNDPNCYEGTLRAFHRHQMVEPLAHPGEVDLTTTVDWTQMKEAGWRDRLESLSLDPLDQFLLREGLLDQLSLLTRDAGAAEVAQLNLGARELIMPGRLASAFQVLVQRKHV